MRIVVTGASGQVGGHLKRVLASVGDVTAVGGPSATDGARLDLRDSAAIARLIRRERPDVLINAAAYTAVDRAEDDVDDAFAVNATAPGVMAEECAKIGALLIHFSTDYVFDGSGSAPWTEAATPAPLNIYGRSKLAGEAAVTATGGSHVILRTSWVFNHTGSNFLLTMLRLGAERERLAVVADQIGAPTSAAFLAAMTARVVATVKDAGKQGIQSGIYHVACAGETSWHGFATEIFRRARAKGIRLKVSEITPITAAEFPTKAARPSNSRLDCRKFFSTFGGSQLPWTDALEAVLKDLR